MFSREELLAQALRRYPEFLRAVVTGEPFFPLELRIGKTRRAAGYAERAAELAGLRSAAASLSLSLEWRLVNDPRFGPHERPERAFFSNEEDFLGALGKLNEVVGFRGDLAKIRATCPALESWLSANIRQVVDHHGHWPELLRVVQWFQTNSRPALYLRQIPVTGVDTKFYERNASILDSLLLHLQPHKVAPTERRFEARHGLLWEEPLVRWRFLDAELQVTSRYPVADLAVPCPVFRSLNLNAACVVITENLRNFLALPTLPGTVAVWGAGNAAVLLNGAEWMTRSRVLYWGDMDGAGYAILSRLRFSYPQAESILMNLATVETHRHLAVPSRPWSVDPPPLLSSEERETYLSMAAESIWLEQERVPMGAVESAFTHILGESSSLT